MAGNIDRIPGGTIVYDWGAFSSVRKAGQDLAMEKAKEIAAAASAYPQPAPSKKYVAKAGPNIAAVVYPATRHARRSNAKHNTLVKLLGERRS